MVVQPKHSVLLSCCILMLLLLWSFASAEEEAVFDPHNCSCLPHAKHHHKPSSGQVEYQSQDKYSSGTSGSMSSSSSSSSSSTSMPSSSSSDYSSSSSSLSQGSQSSSSTSSLSQSTDSSTSGSSQESDKSSSSISSNGNQQTSSRSSQSDHKSSSRSTDINEHSSSGSSQANQETSTGSIQADQQSSSSSSQGNQQTASGSNQADQQSSSSSSQGNQQTASGSIQADQQSSSGSSQGNQQTASGSVQADQQSSSGSSQENQQTSSGSSQGNQQTSSGSSQENQQTSSGSNQGNQQTASGSVQADQQSSSGTSQENQQTSSGSSQGNQRTSSGSSQENQHTSSGSSQGNQQTSFGSSQENQQSSSSSSQGNQQTSSGSSQANEQTASGSSQSNQQISSGSSQGSQQNSSGSSQNQGRQQTSSSTGQQRTVSISISVNATFKGAFKKVYAFGDSNTDTGNAALMDGLKSFLGGIFSNQSPYASGGSLSGYRLSNGRLVIDYLTDVLGLPALSPYKQTSGIFSSGCNFAVAGATALSSDYFASHRISHTLMWKANPETFLTQIDWFNRFLLGMDCKGKGETECKAELEATLFWIGEIGSSDYARIIGSSIFGRWLTELVVGNTCKILKTLLDRGAKYVVVQGLAPQGCCPIGLLLCPLRDRDNLGCASSANAMIKAHNDLLQRKLLEIRAQYPRCTIVYADTWGAYQVILTSYKQYQFVEPFKACCGAGSGLFNFDLHSLCGSTGTSTCNDPNKYINWDGVHLTEAMHKKIAELLFHQGHCYPSFDQLIQARTVAT